MLPSDSIKLLLIAVSLSLSHGKTFEFRLIQSNNIQRLELMQRKCDKYEVDSNELYQNNSIHTLSDADLEHLLIDRKHKFLYCYVPKVSSVAFYWSGVVSCAINLPPAHADMSDDSFFWRHNLRVSWKCQVEILFSLR